MTRLTRYSLLPSNSRNCSLTSIVATMSPCSWPLLVTACPSPSLLLEVFEGSSAAGMSMQSYCLAKRYAADYRETPGWYSRKGQSGFHHQGVSGGSRKAVTPGQFGLPFGGRSTVQDIVIDYFFALDILLNRIWWFLS